jgi:hypothetical protein
MGFVNHDGMCVYCPEPRPLFTRHSVLECHGVTDHLLPRRLYKELDFIALHEVRREARKRKEATSIYINYLNCVPACHLCNTLKREWDPNAPSPKLYEPDTGLKPEAAEEFIARAKEHVRQQRERRRLLAEYAEGAWTEVERDTWPLSHCRTPSTTSSAERETRVYSPVSSRLPPLMDQCNSRQVIFPYKKNGDGAWMFDDASVGLIQEPFVRGSSELIDRLAAEIPQATSGFLLYFSGTPFPGFQMRLKRIREEFGGWWYQLAGTTDEGWLCPAMFKYFAQAPEALFVRAEPNANLLT